MISRQRCPGINCPFFCLDLLNGGVDEEYLNDVAFLLCTGEQAPFNSVQEVWQMSPKRRNYFVKKLSEMYERQREEIENARKR